MTSSVKGAGIEIICFFLRKNSTCVFFSCSGLITVFVMVSGTQGANREVTVGMFMRTSVMCVGSFLSVGVTKGHELGRVGLILFVWN